MLNKKQIMDHWFADLYDQEETYTMDVALLLDTLGPDPKNVLEACCGTGRILLPLALAGHTATGFDKETAMLARLKPKAEGVPHLYYREMDGVTGDWGQGFDVVVLAGNILINIESDMDYKQAQETFLKKAAACLKPGGYLYLDFDLHARPWEAFTLKKERVIFQGTDDTGVTGKCVALEGGYDRDTQMCWGKGIKELTLPNGEKIMEDVRSLKHIPTLSDVTGWLHAYGFKILTAYGDYEKHPIGPDTHRAILYARKEQEKIA
jgi:SAM-dependent methyltransferase